MSQAELSAQKQIEMINSKITTVLLFATFFLIPAFIFTVALTIDDNVDSNGYYLSASLNKPTWLFFASFGSIAIVAALLIYMLVLSFKKDYITQKTSARS